MHTQQDPRRGSWVSNTWAFACGSHARQSSLTNLPRVEGRRTQLLTGGLRWDGFRSIAKGRPEAIIFFSRNIQFLGLRTKAKARTSHLSGGLAWRVLSAGGKQERVPCSRVTRAVILELHHFRKDFPFAI